MDEPPGCPGAEAAAGLPEAGKKSCVGTETPQSHEQILPACSEPPASVSSRAVDQGNRSEKLLQHISEYTRMDLADGVGLPVDFKMTLQLLESSVQHGSLLCEVNAKLDILRQDMDEHTSRIGSGLESRFDEFHQDVLSSLQALPNDCSAEVASRNGVSAKEALQPFLSAQEVRFSSEESDEYRETAIGFVDMQTKPHVMARQVVGTEDLDTQTLHAVSPTSPLSSSLGFDPAEVRRQASRVSDGFCDASQSILHVVSGHMPHKEEKAADYWLRKAIMHPAFEAITALVIILNSFTIGYCAQEAIVWAMKHPGEEQPEEPEVIMILNRFYISFYIIEICLRIWIWRRNFFNGPLWHWNIFDFVLVLAGIYDQISELTQMKFGGSVGVTWLRILRIVKTLKLLRVVRVMRIFQVLRTMVSSIAGSVKTLFWSILMISIIVYIFALCFLQAVTIYLNEHTPREVDEVVMQGIAAYWGSVMQAMMTLFWSVTGGADWEPLAQPIREADAFFYGLFFFYIAFAALAVLNVLTGMFVDTAMKVTAQDQADVVEELTNHQDVRQFRKHVCSRIPDSHRTGCITSDFVDEDHSDVVLRFQRLLEIDAEDCRRVFKLIDTEKKGVVDLEEFIKGCFHAKGSVTGLDMVFLMSETKHLSNHVEQHSHYLEERLNELISHMKPGIKSSVLPWRCRVNDMKSRHTLVADNTRFKHNRSKG